MAKPNQIIQIKTKEKDGYQAVQLGYGKKRKINQALATHNTDITVLHSMFRAFSPDSVPAANLVLLGEI